MPMKSSLTYPQVIGSVNSMLKKIYPNEFKPKYSSNLSAIAFAGFVVGMLFFGYTSDKYSRKWSLLVSTIIMIVFSILATGAYGAGGSVQGLFMALSAYRFFVGVGLGGEYPAGSVGAAEGTNELKAGSRNMWFVMFTNVQIDLGFVAGALVPMIVVSLPSAYPILLLELTFLVTGLCVYRASSPSRVAYLSRHRCHSTTIFALPPSAP
jgi:MFS family permease